MVIVGDRLTSHMTQKKTECRQTGSEFGIRFINHTILQS